MRLFGFFASLTALRQMVMMAMTAALITMGLGVAGSMTAFAAQSPVLRVVFLGDSLTSGYGLQSGEDIVARLREHLQKQGSIGNAETRLQFDNAGVSGDTSSGGLARLEWSIAGDPKPSLVVVALGANDMLRGIDPATTRKNLTAIMDALHERGIPVFLIGMKASINMGEEYRTHFDVIYDDLAKHYDVAGYDPFFLEGVAMHAALNQEDGIHPNNKGVAVIVERLAPQLQKTLHQLTQ